MSELIILYHIMILKWTEKVIGWIKYMLGPWCQNGENVEKVTLGKYKNRL